MEAVLEKRSVLGISFLTKGQLQYELRIRQLPDEGTVAELSQRLRGALERPLMLNAATVGEVSDACAVCDSSLSGVQANIVTRKCSLPCASV